MLGRFVPYPFQNNIHRLPADVFLECLMGIVEAQQTALPRDNFAEWITAVFGDGIARHFMVPYNFKVWAHPLEMMDTAWQGDRVPTVDVRAILENLLDDRDDVGWGPNNKFKFPLLGTGMLYDRIAEALPKPVNLEQGGRRDRPSPARRHVRRRHARPVRPARHHDAVERAREVHRRLPDRGRRGRPATSHHTAGLFVGIGVADAVPEHEVLDVLPRVATRPSTGSRTCRTTRPR